MTTTITLPVAVTKDCSPGGVEPCRRARSAAAHRRDQSAASRYASTLRGKHIALIFEKPSLRTRVTFEVGIQSMGGFVVFLDHTQARLGERESIPDVGAESAMLGAGHRRARLRAARPRGMASNISIP